MTFDLPTDRAWHARKVELLRKIEKRPYWRPVTKRDIADMETLKEELLAWRIGFDGAQDPVRGMFAISGHGAAFLRWAEDPVVVLRIAADEAEQAARNAAKITQNDVAWLARVARFRERRR